MGRRHHQAVLIACIAALLIGCKPIEPTPHDHSEDTAEVAHGACIYRDDSTEWMVWVPYSRVYVYDSYPVDSPYHIPTREEAKILRTLHYGVENVRYLTDDGYTFGMPSASITKAGQKTKYSVLALWRRPTVIEIEF